MGGRPPPLHSHYYTPVVTPLGLIRVPTRSHPNRVTLVFWFGVCVCVFWFGHLHTSRSLVHCEAVDLNAHETLQAATSLRWTKN